MLVKEDEMTKFIRITRSDAEGSYAQRPTKVHGMIDGELLDVLEYSNPGVSITLTVIEMSEEAFDKLPEFTGW
jgi:hypothetical protein